MIVPCRAKATLPSPVGRVIEFQSTQALKLAQQRTLAAKVISL